MEPAQVGLALITIGGGLLGTSIVLAVIGYLRTVKKTFSTTLPYKDVSSFPPPRFSFLPLRLRYDTRIYGKIVPISGPFSLELDDYFPGIPTPEWRWKFDPIVGLSDMNPGNEYDFEVSLKPGDYMLLLIAESKKAEGPIELTRTSYIKPLKRLIDVGLTLFQVALPILVTGFVIYVGLPLT
jgi:hypothetical protein